MPETTGDAVVEESSAGQDALTNASVDSGDKEDQNPPAKDSCDYIGDVHCDENEATETGEMAAALLQSPTTVASDLIGIEELALSGAPLSMIKETRDGDGAKEDVVEQAKADDEYQDCAESTGAAPSISNGTPGNDTPEEETNASDPGGRVSGISEQESFYTCAGYSFADDAHNAEEEKEGLLRGSKAEVEDNELEQALHSEVVKPLLEQILGEKGLRKDDQEALASTVLEYLFTTEEPQEERAKIDLQTLCDGNSSMSSESSEETLIIDEYVSVMSWDTDYDVALADKSDEDQGVLTPEENTLNELGDVACNEKEKEMDTIEAELALIENQDELSPLQESNGDENETQVIVASILNDVVDEAIARVPRTAVEAGSTSLDNQAEASSQMPSIVSDDEDPEVSDTGSKYSEGVPSVTATEDTGDDYAWTGGRIVGLRLPSDPDNTAKPYECRVDPSKLKKQLQSASNLGQGGKMTNTCHPNFSPTFPANHPASIALDIYLMKGSPDNAVKVRIICEHSAEDAATVLERVQLAIQKKLGYVNNATNPSENEENKAGESPGEAALWREKPSGGILSHVSSPEDCLTAWESLCDATLNICDLCCGKDQQVAADEASDEKNPLEGYERVENVHFLTLNDLLNRAARETMGKYAVSVPTITSDCDHTSSSVKLLLDAYPPTITTVSSPVSFSTGRIFVSLPIIVEIGLLCATQAKVIWFAGDDPVCVDRVSYTPTELDVGKCLTVLIIPRRANHDGWECAEAFQFKSAVEELPFTDYDDQLHGKAEIVDGLSKSEGRVRRKKKRVGATRHAQKIDELSQSEKRRPLHLRLLRGFSQPRE